MLTSFPVFHHMLALILLGVGGGWGVGGGGGERDTAEVKKSHKDLVDH